jgi:5-methyltetrahydropteroyltriglutamate--homocysteine methyltransferase
MARTDWRIANAGGYPRIGDTPGQQRLRRTHDQVDTGTKTEADLRAAQDDAVREAVREQIEAGCDLVTDGLIRWHDPVSHPVRALPGIEIDGLLRYFDTNTYFRQPVVKARVAPAPLGLVAEYRFAAGAAGTIPVKAVVTGPYTLAALSIRKRSPYTDTESLARDYAAAVAEEVGQLARAGAPVIQVDEPAILRQPGDIVLLARLLTPLAERKGSARLALGTGFGDAAPVYERLQELPVDILAFDLAYAPSLPAVIGRVGTVRDLALGCVDARNTRLERAADVARALEPLRRAVEGRTTWLSPSASLDTLPRARAAGKLKVLAETKALLSRG